VPVNLRLPWQPLSAGVATIFLVIFSLSACSNAQVGSGTDPVSTSASTLAASQAGPALKQAIQGIDAAIYGYGVIGAYVSRADQNKVERAIATLNRERLTFELALGLQINERAVAYQLPNPVTDSASAKALAELLEMKLLALFNDVAKNSTGLTKKAAELASTKATNRAAGWITTPAPKSTP
jgi:hypothetical protein